MADTTPDTKYPPGSASAMYEAAVKDREPFRLRAEESAKLTIPSIMPPLGHTSTSKLYSPFQSVGARGVKNLAAKLLLSLLPPNSPFFRFSMSNAIKTKLSSGDPELKTQIEAGLNEMEHTVATEIEGTTLRVTAAEAFLHFLITGNVLLQIPEDGHCRMFSLNQYICKRDPNGRLRRIITKEETSMELLSEGQQVLVKANHAEYSEKPTDMQDAEKPVCIYTRIELEDGQWKITQELNGVVDPEVNGHYPLEAPGFIALRFRKVDGEDYGRGYVEEIIGDLRSLEGLSMSIVEAASAMAKMLILVNPNGVTSKKTISNSPNLAVRDGRAEDVTFMRAEKGGDLQFTDKQIERLERRLELAFLLNTAVQRDAERVTAEEIRYVAQELEDSQGGVYSILAQEFQMPLAYREIAILQKKKQLPILPKGAVKPQVITGLEALGRGHDLTRINQLVEEAKSIIQPPEQIGTYLDIPDLLKQAAIAIGLDPKSVKSAADVQAQQQAQQQQSLTEKVAPNLVNKAGDVMKQQHAAQQQTPAQPVQQ